MAILIHPQVSKNGGFTIVATNTGNTAVANITSISGSPSVFVGGSAATLYGPVWPDSIQDSPFAFWQITSPAVTSASVITYTIPANCVNTALGGNTVVSSQASVPNSIGSLEQVYGGVTPFTAPPTMQLGMNMDNGAWINFQTQPHAANLALRMAFGGVGCTLSFDPSDGSLPLSWTSPSTGSIEAILKNYQTSNGIEIGSGQDGYPVLPGSYAFRWDDANVGTGAEMQLVLVGDSNTNATGSTGNVDSGFPRTNGVRTVSGTKVTITYANVAYKSVPNLTHGYNLDLVVFCKSTAGLWSSGGTITNFQGVGPGDTFAMLDANPYAIPTGLKTAMSGSNGNGPSIVRMLNPTALNGYGNYQDFADINHIGQFSYAATIQKAAIPLSFARRYSTDPTNPIVAWNTTKLYNSRLGFDGTDAVGKYIDMTLRSHTTNNGEYTNPVPGQGTTASIEFVSTSPHNLRTGDKVQWPLGSDSNPFILPITGGTVAALSGHVTVNNGSRTITFASSQSLADGQGLTFDAVSDTTGQAYKINNGGVPFVGTVATIDPNYGGTSSTTATASTTAYASTGNILPDVYVTGASTFVANCGATVGITSGTTVQHISSTVQIPLNYSVTPQEVGGNAPYGFGGRIAQNWSNCKKVQVPIQPYMSDACLDAVGDEMAANSANGTEWLLELCDEVWNNTFPAFSAIQGYGNMVGLLAATTAVNEFYTVPGSPVGLDKYQAYPVILAHARARIQARFVVAGKGQKASLAIGVQATDDVYAGTVVAFCNTNSIPFDYLMIAPYQDSPDGNNTTWVNACASGGGAWPCALMMDFFRFYMKYSSSIWSWFSLNYAHLITYTAGGPIPKMIGYEGGLQLVGPSGVKALEHDCFYHPEFRYAYNAALQAAQDGSPLVPGSGIAWMADYTFGSQWGNGDGRTLWSIQVMEGQAAVDGTSNIFTTAQGGSPGDGLCHDISNGSVALLAAQQWFAAANGAATGASLLMGM